MSEVLKVIKKRHSSRVPFDPSKPITKETLTQILDAARWTPTGHNMQNYEIIVVDDKATFEKIGSIKSPVQETFLRDNLTHLSYSDEELKRKKVGISAAGFPPDWVDPSKISEVVAKSPPIPVENYIRGSPVLLVVLYDPNRKAPVQAVDVYGFMSLGCLMENVWLAAEALGVGMQILSLSATASVEKEFKQLLDVPEALKIAYTIRLGYPTTPVKGIRVRRDIADFTYNNSYNKKGL
jgi:nitroreductase